MNISEPILLFDGTCNLCNELVRFIVKQDRDKKIRFTPLQSSPGKRLLEKFDISAGDMDSVVFISGEKYFLKSSAAIHVMIELGGGWRLFYGFMIFPKFIRDFFYSLIASNRSRIFGRRDSCMVPSPEIQDRFLL